MKLKLYQYYKVKVLFNEILSNEKTISDLTKIQRFLNELLDIELSNENLLKRNVITIIFSIRFVQPFIKKFFYQYYCIKFNHNSLRRFLQGCFLIISPLVF